MIEEFSVDLKAECDQLTGNLATKL